jgi:hypothetical protein
MVVQAPVTKGKVVTDGPAVVVEIQSPEGILDRYFDFSRLAVRNIVVANQDIERA